MPNGEKLGKLNTGRRFKRRQIWVRNCLTSDPSVTLNDAFGKVGRDNSLQQK
jgi:hypothetical protein